MLARNDWSIIVAINEGGRNSWPLDGITVLDFSHVLSGPFGTSLLGDLGADVIKVEPLEGDMVRLMGPPFQGGESSYFLSVNRNKRSMVVDLKHSQAPRVVRKMIAQSDVLIENFRPGVMERLGLGYRDASAVNADIIYASLTAFGESGPYRDRPGFELNIQALTGLVDVTTPRGQEPAKIQIQVVDLAAGMFLTIGVLGALFHRERTGRGQRVATSMLESTLAMMANLVGIHLSGQVVPTNMASRNPQAFPSQAFKTSDGHVTIVGHWDRLARALGHPEWEVEPTLSSNAFRVDHYDEMTRLVESITRTKSTFEWLEVFREHDVAAAPVNTIEECFADPAVTALDMVKTVEHATAGDVDVLDKPWHMSVSAGGLRYPPPALGEHTDDILLEFGFTETEVRELIDSGVVFERKSGQE